MIMTMTTTTDDIFDNVDLGLDEPNLDPQEPITDDFTDDDVFKEDTPSTNSVIDSLLASKGINDGKFIMVEEDGTEVETNFYNLSLEEQLEILNQGEVTETPDLDESEMNLLNTIRSSGLNTEQYLEQYKQQILSELGQDPVQNYEIDSYTDQELYVLDLKNKFDLTEDELVTELEKELQNEDIFNRKVTKLREEYKKLEDEYKQTQQQEFEAQKQQQYDQFAQQMVDVAVKTEDFYGVELEDNEKNEVLSFLLELDESGTSNFYKTLNNPQKLYEAAWFLRYGKDAFEALKGAYESEIVKLKKGDKPQVVVRKDNKKINSIHDLNF